MNWRSKAVCATDINHSYWLSYNLDKISYAIDGCNKCTVKRECLLYNMELDNPMGVIAGTTEFDRLLLKWKKADDLNDNNWE